jgi:tetratricopeptide (TPR) repeat protein
LVTTTLVLAQINFVKKNYQKSLELYKKCLELNKNLPTNARLGMAYSFFYLGKYEMAKACFQRILKLAPNCV